MTGFTPLGSGNGSVSQPFFTIGIPTYNRHGMLQEALASVLAQTFTDFEVIVGNDYTAEVLTCEMLGITDSRIRIINNPRNLREVGNMNALLDRATGNYFTWLFDDDLYEPDFLQTAHDCLVKSGFPPALFSSFRMLKPSERFQPRRINNVATLNFTGRGFLDWYSDRRPKITSTCGLFHTATLRKMVGGVEEMCSSAIGFHCEYLFLVRCALLDTIVYMDVPCYVFRRHGDSASESNQDLENYRVAGQELLKRCSDVLHHPTLMATYSRNLLKIARIHIITYAYSTARFEFAQKKSLVGTFYRAMSNHGNEASHTRALYARLGGDTGFRTSFAFLRVRMYCWYVIVRLLTHFANGRVRHR
ncbi:glycosyltransferase family 2 protein [Geomobilimonas luticola]|uniref:Glycosyltransferase family 2 protein n=1 Tax=Geomobilimonas luticola TaxID=1114878 RepID=A0ABS5SEP2_9BACT|nr:glycosyltransferase family 2 protein [Geomobilimonas luticola]MBT0653843.1 glycosyltransferase family 2 protein [Geomobilimonas luticola]